MKLYYSKGACSLSVRILIHELKLSCQFEAVNLKTKQTEHATNFLEINPKGAVPVLVLDNKEILTENIAIQQYLADTNHAHTLLPSIPNLERYHILEGLSFVSSDLHKNFGPLFNPDIPQTMKDDIFKPIVERKLNYLNSRLEKNAYLCGDEFTLADPYLFVILRWLSFFSMPLSKWQHIDRYFEVLKKRESIHQALSEEGLSN